MVRLHRYYLVVNRYINRGSFSLCCVTESEKSFCKQKCDAISDWLKTEFNIVLDAMFLTESEFQKRKNYPFTNVFWIRVLILRI